MGIAALNIDEMISGFPNLVLPLLTVEPTFEDIMNTQKMLNDNCISFPSLTGGGRHDQLGLIMMVQEYASTLPTRVGVTVDPGPIAQVSIGVEVVEAASRICLHEPIGSTLLTSTVMRCTRRSY
jgi:hypothetical protein